tara:strand:- start:3487 stop:3783 length:297 start_codon:yes stop_codon:yes gene_type:complete
MAHYAYLDENNVVVDIIVGKNETELIDGLHPEAYYALGTPYTVKRTSFNGRIRYNFAGLGYTYDPEADAFIPLKSMCHPGVILDTSNYRWVCDNAEHP